MDISAYVDVSDKWGEKMSRYISYGEPSDLIERSEVLKQLRLDHKDVIYIDKVECAKRIKAIPSARPKGEWIPCSERLPKRQGYYICTCKDGSKYKRTTTVKWSNGWQLAGARAYWIVLAWMPLPKPWEGADDERLDRERQGA